MRDDEDGFLMSAFRREPWLAAIPVILLSLILGYAFVSDVGPDEIIVKDCGGVDQEVWRGHDEGGLQWDGLCRTATYHAYLREGFSERVATDGVDARIRGTIVIMAPVHDEDLLRIYEDMGGSEERFVEAIWPGIMQDVMAAAADPAWHRPQGGIVKRELKGALEYGLKRVSPTGHLWTAPEARRALQEDIQRRLDARLFPRGVTVKITLGFLTER
jgi:hypothetical protein